MPNIFEGFFFFFDVVGISITPTTHRLHNHLHAFIVVSVEKITYSRDVHNSTYGLHSLAELCCPKMFFSSSMVGMRAFPTLLLPHLHTLVVVCMENNYGSPFSITLHTVVTSWEGVLWYNFCVCFILSLFFYFPCNHHIFCCVPVHAVHVNIYGCLLCIVFFCSLLPFVAPFFFPLWVYFSEQPSKISIHICFFDITRHTACELLCYVFCTYVCVGFFVFCLFIVLLLLIICSVLL